MLIYTPLLGLRKDAGYPEHLCQGIYARAIDPNGSWSMTVLNKNMFGRTTHIEWVTVEKSRLPAKLKLEALIQGIPL